MTTRSRVPAGSAASPRVEERDDTESSRELVPLLALGYVHPVERRALILVGTSPTAVSLLRDHLPELVKIALSEIRSVSGS